jgi:alkanesulfonate monooxygenase SsuD/methylene tetrahydromethanopterin reductase-like flavin-dependent oxidoreductase (luciferase family)
MKIGLFDHVERSDRPLATQFDERLKFAVAAEAAGIYCLHVAEHHATPLNMVPVPGVYLGAVARATTRLRLGPLVYLLPLYSPLRLIEEICMLDHMSGGRLLLGVGRGVSPFETKAYGLDFAQTGDLYHEAFQLVLKGLATDELSFEGKHYQYRNVPMILRPLQRPHPPLWYGTTLPDNADWPAANDVNIVSIALRPTVRVITDRYRAVRHKLGKPDGPLLGVARHVVVAETDAAARRIAQRAYPRWRESFLWLFQRHGAEPRIAGLYPPSFDELAALDNGIAGTPATVREFLAKEIEASGVNYLLSWFSFGDMTRAEALASIELFAREVMPAFAKAPAS